MTQATAYSVPLVGPASPTVMAQRIDDNFDAIISGHSGSARPTYAVAGMIWEDTSVAGETRLWFYDGSQDILVAIVDTANDRVELAPQPLVDVASAATTDIGAVKSRNIRVTGSVTITSFGTIRAGTTKTIYFASALTVTYNATSLITPTGANLVVVAGDSIDLVSLGSGNWRVLRHVIAAQTSIKSAASVSNPNTAAVLFSNIPAGVKRIVIDFDNVTLSTSSYPIIRLGHSGGVQSTVYNAAAADIGGYTPTALSATDSFLTMTTAISTASRGHAVLKRVGTSNNWTCSGLLQRTTAQSLFSGEVALIGDLTQIQITTPSGVALLNGIIGLSWEF